MKYFLLKIIGILGLVTVPIVMNGHYDLMKETGSIVARSTWYEGFILLLIVFLIITMAGFARLIAKVKAIVDFYTDFDDDQHLECYPKLKIFAFVKKIVAILVIVSLIVLGILSNWVPFISNNFGIIVLAELAFVFILFLASIIICLITKIIPLYYDISIVFAVLGMVLDIVFAYCGVNYIVSMMITAPLYAISVLYMASALDDFISIDEVFDWICDDEYNEYYKKLCDKEKEKEEKKELSGHRQNKKAKIETKQTVRAEKKKVKQAKKEEKKSASKKEK